MKQQQPLPGRWLGTVRSRIYEHLIVPFQQTHAPIWEVARGTTIGLFIGLTPTMGVQMYVTALVWVICRYGLRYQFHLGIAIAMVWVSNPITFLPMYFAYLKTGDWLLHWIGYAPPAVTFASFKATVHAVNAVPGLMWAERLVRGLWALVLQFGWPLVVGSLVYAIPLTVLAYPATSFGLLRYRHRLAAQEGITYQEWRARYEHLE